MKGKLFVLGFLSLLICQYLTGSEVLYLDLRKGIALVERSPNFWQVLPILSSDLSGSRLFDAQITQVYLPPETRYALPFVPPVALRLENGLILSNREGYGDIAVELPEEKPALRRMERIVSIAAPWAFEGKALVIDSDEWIRFLPYYLNYLGKGALIDTAMARAKSGVFPFKMLIEEEPLRIEVRGSASYPFLPIFVRLQANLPLARYRWSEGATELSSLLDFRKEQPGQYTLSLFAEDIYGQTVTLEIPVTINPFVPPVKIQEITDRATVGSRVLFIQRTDGVWNLWDTQIKGARASIAFPFPGEFDILFAAPKTLVRYRISVE